MMSGQLKALLAVLAVAGYQNRDKIGELLRGIKTRSRPAPEASSRAGSAASSGGSAARVVWADFSAG